MKKFISLALVACLALSIMVMSVGATGTDNGVTRAEWAEKIVEAAGGIPAGAEKADLADTAEASDAVKYLIAEGVILGYKDGNFKGEQVATVEEAVAMVARAVEAKVLNVAKVSEAGVANEEASEYAQEAFATVANCGIEVTAAPKAALTAELAAEIVPQITTKFYFGVLSGDGYVTAHVNGNYEMAISVADEKVTANKITLEAAMINVGSLDVAGKKSHSISVETGLSGDPDLDTWLKNCFEFKGATANIDVADAECVYNVQPTVKLANGDAVICFVPADVADTRAAWQKLTSAVSTSTQAQDDSFILIKNGSELTLGGETLKFENVGVGDLKLDNFSDLDALEAEIRGKVKVEAANSSAVSGKLAAGTQLAVGQTIAQLDKTVEVTIEGGDFSSLNGLLSDLRGAGSTYAMAETLVKTVNELVGALSEKTVDIAVVIG